MYKHIYRYVHCATSDLQESLNYLNDYGYEIVHMSQTANGAWLIVYDVNPRGAQINLW